MVRYVTSCLRFALVFMIFMSTYCEAGAQRSKTEILWDNYGVPHIYAKNAAEMYYAFGRAQMASHTNLILRLYAQSRGRASEYFGPSYAASDKKILSFRLPELAEKGCRNQSQNFQLYLEAFVKGMNEYASGIFDSIEEPYRKVLPVTINDVLAHTIRVICLEFLAGEDIGTVNKITVAGSNSIAIGPARSASGNAMLLTNPHLPWYDFFTWFEAHLNSDDFSAYGIALVGMPSLSMAFNNNLGWAHTVNPIDASDRYELTLKDDGYVLDGETIPFEKRTIIFKIRQDDGSLKDSTFVLKSSMHGPIIGEKGDKAYAVRIAGLENCRIFEQYHRMALSRNLKEFESALGMMQNPMFNIMYADRDGNILYLFNGNVPVRSEGDFHFWRNTVSGTESKYIWKEIHPYRDLPRVLNPSTGFLQNCNDPPWTCTFPGVLKPEDFPAYFAPQGMGLRPQRAVNMIKDNHSITFDQLVEYKLNTGMEAASRFLDDLLKAAEEFPDPMVQKAALVLKNWDRKTDSGSRGAILFAAWWDGVNNSLFDNKWSENNPVNTPNGIKDKEAAVKILAGAASEVMARYGSLDIPWGDIYRFRLNGLDFPANGGPDSYGIFRTIYYTDSQNNTKTSVAGDTYIAVIEFGKDVKAEVLLSYGNSSQSGNKYYGDQLKLMSEKKLRPALLRRAAILKNLDKRETLKDDMLK